MGVDLQWRVNGLDSKTDYTIKVAVVRVPEPGMELVGSYSPPAVFSTLSGTGNSSSMSGSEVSGLNSNHSSSSSGSTIVPSSSVS